MRLDGKIAVVTGGASGIGEATVMAFAEAGARLIVADRNEELGRKVACAVQAAGGEAEFFGLDVADEQAVARMVELAERRFGGLDCAVNSAGIAGTRLPMLDTPTAMWTRVWEVDGLAIAFCLKYQIAAMLKRGGGSIINIASGAGLFGVSQLAPYSAAKHAVIGMTRSAALEFGKSNVRVNAICPGLVQTPINGSSGFDWATVCNNPLGRVGQPHEIADAALWLASDRSTYVTGQAIPVDGGLFAGT